MTGSGRGPLIDSWLVDFDDSFTHNVAAELLRAKVSCQVVPWRRIPHERSPQLVVLGPGPGHPDDYHFNAHLHRWLSAGTPMLAVCLGHQLLARHLGLPVTRSLHPMHGQVITPTVPKAWEKVLGLEGGIQLQRYNSLAVPAQKLPPGWMGWEFEGEWIALKGPRVISYQFHPESVGTSCPQAFFEICRRL